MKERTKINNSHLARDDQPGIIDYDKHTNASNC